MNNSSSALTSSDIEETIAWRHHLHSIPELAFEEHATAAFVAERLTSFGYSVTTGVGRTGVVATLSRGTSRKSIGLRADFDAIPGTEESGVSYASRSPGKMHGCGHDGHTAMLLGAAKSLATTDGIDGTVHFIFQPAEEVEGGGQAMVEDGLFQRFPVDAVFAIHNWPALALNSVSATPGPVMAAFGIFDIEIRGRGAHGGMPHEGADPNVAAFHIGSALQSVVSRNASPLSSGVISITTVNGGNAYNVIPESCRLTGTTRWLEPSVGDLIDSRLREIAVGVGNALGCDVAVTYQRRYPVTMNDPKETEFVQAALRRIEPPIALVTNALPSMGAEDFAFMLNEVPGAYLWLGAEREGNNPPLHSPHYDFNDQIVGTGVNIWRELVLSKLG